MHHLSDTRKVIHMYVSQARQQDLSAYRMPRLTEPCPAHKNLKNLSAANANTDARGSALAIPVNWYRQATNHIFAEIKYTKWLQCLHIYDKYGILIRHARKLAINNQLFQH